MIKFSHVDCRATSIMVIIVLSNGPAHKWRLGGQEEPIWFFQDCIVSDRLKARAILFKGALLHNYSSHHQEGWTAVFFIVFCTSIILALCKPLPLHCISSPQEGLDNFNSYYTAPEPAQMFFAQQRGTIVMEQQRKLWCGFQFADQTLWWPPVLKC